MKWKTRQAAFDDIKALVDRFGLDLLSARILAGRGVCTPESAKFYLESDISFLHNPFLFEDMELFCDRVLQAIEDNEKVRVFGDPHGYGCQAFRRPVSQPFLSSVPS